MGCGKDEDDNYNALSSASSEGDDLEETRKQVQRLRLRSLSSPVTHDENGVGMRSRRHRSGSDTTHTYSHW